MTENVQAQLMRKVVLQLPDGSYKFFDTQQEATSFLQYPKQIEALNKLTEDEELSKFLLENRESVEDALEGAKIRRVTKAERNQLQKALDKIDPEDKGTRFLVDYKDEILNSFRWPTQKRVAKEDQAAVIKAALTELFENNEELADWVVENAEGIKEAYQAGVVKRELNPAAAAGLAAYQARMKAEKAAREAAESKNKPAETVASDTDEEEPDEEVVEEAPAPAPAPAPKRTGKKK